MGRRVNLADLAADDVPDTTPHAPAAPAPAGVSELPVTDVAANPLNQRDPADEDPDELERMAETIAQHGVLQPLVVCAATTFLDQYPQQREALAGARWVTLIGNRRLAAARLAGLERVPAIVNNDRSESMYEVMLVENFNRRDLAPLREAEAMSRVLDREDLSQRDLAKRIGRTHTYVRQRLALLGLIAPLRVAFEAGQLTVERARELGTLSPEEQHAIVDAGPAGKPAGGNGVSSRRRHTLPPADPAAAAQSIKALYSGPELAELVRLLSD